MKIRLNKYLADYGIASRRASDALIEEGRVLVNGKRPELGQKVDKSDEVTVDGVPLEEKPEYIYIAFHKPEGVITTTDTSKPKNVISMIGIDDRIYPIGRLDVKSSGLLLFTNHGDLANKIMHPRYAHEKEYEVTIKEPISDLFIKQMTEGVNIGGKKTKLTKIKRINSHMFSIVLKQGRNRQIRLMCGALGYHVKKLKRIRVMDVKLGGLGPGSWRELTKKERESLLKVLWK